jgi:hypothetical protein
MRMTPLSTEELQFNSNLLFPEKQLSLLGGQRHVKDTP